MSNCITGKECRLQCAFFCALEADADEDTAD
jgi:hypothetical protein